MTWAWPGSFLAPSQCHFHHGEASAPTPRRNCFWLICQAPPRNQSRRGGRGQQNRGKGPLPTQSTPNLPQPQETTSGAPALLSSLGKGSQGLKSGEGRMMRKEHGTVCPRWERPRGRESCDVWRGPVLQRLLGLGSHRLLCGPEARAQGSVSSLPNLDLVPPGYFESWSSLAFCRIWQTSVMG